MKGIREVYTAEQLYEQLRYRLSQSDAWIADKHSGLLQTAEAMVEALQKKESYGGGVAQRAAHLAAHLKAIDPVLSRWLEKQQALEAAKAAREAAAAPPTDSPRVGGSGGGSAVATTPAANTLAPAAAMITTTTSTPPAKQGGNERTGAAGAGRETGSPAAGHSAMVGDRAGSGSGASSGASPKGPPRKGSSKGGAATALEYLTTTFAHLREQRTLVMGDKKDRLLKEVAGLRQLRSEPVNVLRGAKASETTMADMLAALKAADADPRVLYPAAPPVSLAGDGAAPMEVDLAAAAALGSHDDGDSDGAAAAGGQVAEARKGHLDNLTCVVWEDWRIPERLDKLLQAGDTVCVYVEVHCRDGPEDTRLAMRLNTFVALALCSQRLIAELYQDMFITPQRAASARPQRKRQRTVAEETVQTLDESPDSLDFVDFVEALHRRMPLRCGWMYANAILPSAGEWDRVFGRHTGRLSGLYDGGPELDALGRACLAFHHTRHESPVLDVHVLASQLRQQQQQWKQKQPAGSQQQRVPSGWPRSAVELARASVVAPSTAAAAAAVAKYLTGGESVDGSCRSACCSDSAAPSLILRPPYDSSGRGQGLDLGHLSFTCVTAAPLSDDFLGEVIRQTTAGQAAVEVAEAAAAAAALKASRCIANNRVGCTGTCVEDAAAAAAAAEAAAAAAADYASWGGLEGDGEDEEERELFDAVNEELQAVEKAAVEAEREVEVEMEMMEVQTRVKEEEEEEAAGAGAQPGMIPTAASTCASVSGLNGPHLKGAFSHRMQLMPGVFFSYYIGSQAFTNTAWHVEDFLLQSINLMMVGRPKAWWWVPRDKEAVFKEYLEEQWDAEEVYTKSVPLASIPLEKLIKMGVRRSVQLPGSVFITSPGYAFHTTMSSGWSMADSANFMANIVGKDMHVLEDERPLEQYPATEGRTNTGEWVRFTMRRIEELRARNNITYQPRQMRRIREEVQARRAAAAAVASKVSAATTMMATVTAAATAAPSLPVVKAERSAVLEDKMLTAPPPPQQGHSLKHGNSSQKPQLKLKVKVKVEESGPAGLVGPQLELMQQPPQPKPRQRNDKALLQAYVQAKAAQKAEVQAAAQAAAQRRQARVAARHGQYLQTGTGMGTGEGSSQLETLIASAPAPALAPALPALPVAPAPAQPPAPHPVVRKVVSTKVGVEKSHGKGRSAGGAAPATVGVATTAAATSLPRQHYHHHHRHRQHQDHYPHFHMLKAEPAPQKPVVPVVTFMADQRQEQQQQQQQQQQQLLQQQLQQQLAMQYQPVFLMVPEQPTIEVQPQNFSEQELLAGLLPGVLRGLLPEATVMLQQQKQMQQQQQQEERLWQPPAVLQTAQECIEYRKQQEPVAAATATTAMDGVAMDDGGAAGGVVAMEMPWRVAVA